MLSEVNPIPTIAVKDVQVARDFYENKLGLTPMKGGDENLQIFKSGNGSVEVYKSEAAGKNQSTSMTWTVGDALEDEVKSLKDKGITFEHYDMPDAKLEDDIHVLPNMKAAWFKDPDGNILCLHDHW